MKLEQVKQQQKEVAEKYKFNFEEIEDLLPAFVDLVTKLKDKIEKGEYETLVSDEGGGRIPTLVLRNIIKEITPKLEPKTVFIGGGKAYVPGPDLEEKYDLLLDTLRDRISGAKKVLVITQFTHKGNSIRGLVSAIHTAGVKDVDIASLDSAYIFKDHKDQFEKDIGKDSLFIGGPYNHSINEKHEHLGGIRKSGEYNPTVFSQKNNDLIKKEGRLISVEKWSEFFVEPGDKPWDLIKRSKDPERIKKFEEYKFSELTDAEKKEIQDSINKARADAKYLALKIIKEVWGR